jgi:hypothetical protein
VSTTQSDVTSNVTHPGILPQVSAPAVSPARSKSGGKEQGAASSRDGSGRARGLSFVPFNRILTVTSRDGSGRARGLSFVPFNRILTVTQIVFDRSSIFNTCMHQNHTFACWVSAIALWCRVQHPHLSVPILPV